MQETKKFRVNLGTFDLVKGIAMMLIAVSYTHLTLPTICSV